MTYLHDVAARLVAADTVSHKSCVAALEALADDLERFGFRCALHRYARGGVAQANLVAVAGPAVPGGLALSGHVDVVPFADQPGWTRDPLRLGIDDARVHGRGTSDMKGFLAQCMDAARRLDPASLERPLVLIFTAEEEVGCRGAGELAPALAGLLGDCPLPTLCWIGEPTGGRVHHAHKGVVAFDVTVRGQGGHSSRPEAGVNAIAVAARALAVVGAVQAERRERPRAEFLALYPDAPYTSANFGEIRGGTAPNMIAETCTFSVCYRPLPDEDPLGFYEEVRQRLAAGDLRDWGSPERPAAIALGEPTVAPGLLSRRGTPLEAALFDRLGVAESGGLSLCTDGGQLARLGVDSLICGPGEIDQAHQPDESLPRAAFERGADDVLAVVGRLCGGTPRA